MAEITRIEDLQSLVQGGETNWKQYGEVIAQEIDGLVLFNYSPLAQVQGRWNTFEQISRGLILNRATGEIVARPFDKFWNWLEGGRKASGHVVTITEKLDGSLGILYRVAGQYKIATRGSMVSEQALWATEFLKKHSLEGLSEEYTLLFEIIYPENRVVVDYGKREMLALLAVRNRVTGHYLPFFPDVYTIAHDYGFPTVRTFSFNSIEDVIASCGEIDANSEGYVVEFSDGSRWKFKGDRYRELHKLVTGLSYKRVLQAIEGGIVDQLFQAIPDEFLGQAREWQREIEKAVYETKAMVENAFATAPSYTDRKTFAQWATRQYRDIAPYLFARLDNKDIRSMILNALARR